MNPLEMMDTVVGGREERDRLEVWRKHAIRWRCVWTKMGFCAADKLHGYTSKSGVLVAGFAVEDLPSAELQPRFLRLQ